MANVRGLVTASLGLLAASAENCPDFPDPYRDEENPFGWPLTPGEWDFEHPSCWAAKYPMCGGDHQSPMNIDLTLGADVCLDEGADQTGNLTTNYKAVTQKTVKVSQYMRSVTASGVFGSITVKDAQGNHVEYVAEQMHLMHGSLHKISGAEAAAELLIVHKPQTPSKSLPSHLMLSLLFEMGTGATGKTDIFKQLGLADQRQGSTFWTSENIYLDDVLKDALSGTSYSYSGSLPVPPCTESVHYIVLGSKQHVSASELQSLKDTLTTHAGGAVKRPNAERKPEGQLCRNVAVNSVTLPEASAACPAGAKDPLPVTCWTDHCDLSPVNVETTGGTPQSAPAAHYKATSHVEVSPSDYSLDAVGDFGSMMVNGRLFVAKKVSFKAISQHAYNGQHHAGELVIHHYLFGDHLDPKISASKESKGSHRRLDNHEGHTEDAGHHGESEGGANHTDANHTGAQEPHDGAAHDDHGDHAEPEAEAEEEEDEHDDHEDGGAHQGTDHHDGGHTPAPHPTEDGHGDHADGDHQGHGGDHHAPAPAQPTEAYVPDGPHMLLVTIPLKLGKESEVLRAFGLGAEAHKHAIRSGNSFDVTDPIDLKDLLQPSMSKMWHWYSGGLTAPGKCPSWGVKWMVFEEPLEVSLTQLNFLHLDVSGFDSTMPLAAAPNAVSAGVVPADGVEPVGECSTSQYKYLKPSCWSTLCSTGKAQSPINVETSSISVAGDVRFLPRVSWKPVTGLRLKHDDESIGFDSKQLAYARVTGANGFPKYYQALSVHLRVPSEHMVDGHLFAAELQILHKNQDTVLDFDDEDLLYTSIFFEEGESSKLMTQLLPEKLPNASQYVVLEQPVDLMWSLGPALDGPFYSYNGSSTSTCAEDAQWVLFEKPLTMSKEQLMHFKTAFPNPGNNRPIQALNGRSVVKNTLLEPDQVEYRFFLNRENGHDRSDHTQPWKILFPIFGTLSLCITIMYGTFVREEKRQMGRSAGGFRESPEERATMLGRRS